MINLTIDNNTINFSKLSMFTKDDIEEKYSSGAKNFSAANLERADLENIFLSRIYLNQANLNNANLKNSDLSDANLTESSLVNANLANAHLTGIDLSNADLTNADFTDSILTQANFREASLEKTSFMSAVLIEANFTKVDLSKTNLSNANLKDAVYDDDTIFPSDFDPVSKGMVNQSQSGIEDLLTQFNHLCKCSNKYLGNAMTTKYFTSSRPDYDWLNKFAIDNNSQIICEENITASVTSERIKLFHQWLDAFFNSCSSIIKGFEKLI